MMSTKHSTLSIEDQPTARNGGNRSGRSFHGKLAKFVPLLNWLPKYTQLQAVSDLVAGITLGLTMIPQSIAYAALAGLTAQYGLYSSFLGAYIYVIFGTIKEVSIGPTSLMALLTLEYTRDMPIDFIVLLCFLSGCVELLMGVLNLGFMVNFISIPVTSGFTSATSVIIIVSQLQGLLGLRYKSSNIVDNINKMFQHVPKIRLADFGLGLSCIVFLLLLNKLKDLDCSSKDGSNGGGRTKKILWFLSISRNAIAVLITSTIAFHLESSGSSPFILSGKVKSGLPSVALPPFSSRVGNETYNFIDMCKHYGPGVFVVPLVAVLANVAIAKAFASGATVNASQEMLTLGLCNIFGSFVSSMPTCGAFTRSAVSSASGVQTPMAGLYSGIMTLLALSFLTPYFYYIPRATLAAILISAVVFMIDVHTVRLLWKGCRWEAIVTIITFFVCVICGVEVGLFAGAVFSLIFLLRPTAKPKIEVETNGKYVMVKLDSSVYYPAADFLCTKMSEIAREYDGAPVIVNCKRLEMLDYTTIKGMEKLTKDLNREGNRLWFLNVRPDIVKSIKILGDNKHFHFIDDEERLDDIIYEKVATLTSEENSVKIRLDNLKGATEEQNFANGKKDESERDKLLTGLNGDGEKMVFREKRES